MTVYGYARVSTIDQSLDIQIAALKTIGCEKVRSEKQSGTTTNGRQELKTLLEFIDAGDVLMITRIDRPARSIGDLQDIVRALKAKGVALRALEQPIDTSTAAGKAFLDMLGVFAEFETNLRKERQMEGIAKAKAAGVYKGRPPYVDRVKIAEPEARGFGPSSKSPASSASAAPLFTRALAEDLTVSLADDPGARIGARELALASIARRRIRTSERLSGAGAGSGEDVKMLRMIQGVRTKRSMATSLCRAVQFQACSTRCLNMVNEWLPDLSGFDATANPVSRASVLRLKCKRPSTEAALLVFGFFFFC